MDVLAVADITTALKEWAPPIITLLVASAVAFGIGLMLRYRRAKIQREYQQRMERLKKKQPSE